MPEYVDIETWPIDRIRRSSHSVLPNGWELKSGTLAEYGTWIQILSSDKVVWNASHLDERIVWISAYCWLLLREQPSPPPNVSVWGKRRGELTARGVTQRILSSPDPEDLDPDEIKEIYRRRS
jgi:hypothetical protein